MKKHIFPTFLVTFLVIILLAGCAKTKKEFLTVTMSLGEEEWRTLRQQVFPLFESKYNVKINSYQLESGQLATKLQALQSARKSVIDVFAQDNMNLAILINKGLVTDLSSYRSDISDKVLSNLIEACEFEGKLMFMPFRPNVQIIYYNEEIFNKYNLKPPKTWDELLMLAERFKKEENTGRVLFKAFGGNPTATQIYEFILQAGGKPYSFNDAGCIQAFTFLQKLAPNFSSESKRAKWDTTNDILARREAYLAQNWPFGVVILVKEYELDFIKTYSGWSGPEGEYHVIGGDVFGVPKNSDKKELALKFISYMQSKEVQQILTARLGWPSIREDAYAEVEDWQKPYFQSVKQALKHGVFREQIRWWPVYAKYVTKAFEDIVSNGAPVEETLEKYKAGLEKEKTSINFDK